jgi:LCP family protein required for cell wall assembly
VNVRRRTLIAVTALVAWVAGSALGSLGAVAPASAQTGLVIGKAHAGFAPSLTGDEPIVLLIVGSGARLGDDVEHSLADSLHVVTINPDKHKATIIGIPRDSWVEVPGRGSTKINASLVEGGPDLLVQTVESISGLTIDYYALTTFWGIKGLYENIGGLTIDVPFSMHDFYSEADFEPGVQTLNGQEVLAFSRDRHSLNSGDFGRQENGGRVLIASLAQFRKEFQADQSTLFTWVASGMRNVETNVPFDEIVALAYTCSHINPKGVTNVVLPGTTGFEGSLSVVHLLSDKDAIFADVKPDGILGKKHIPPSPTANET